MVFVLYLHGRMIPLINTMLDIRRFAKPFFQFFFSVNTFSRYAPATQLWRGRLHVMGGSKEDRHEPGLEHWSLAVKDGNALEQEWRSEIPIPRGGPHRSVTLPSCDISCHFH